LALLKCVPESPRFTYAQGDEIHTLEVLRKMFKMNTGKSADEYSVKTLKICGDYGHAKILSQAAQIFDRENVKNILTACFLQFSICVTGNGYWTFFTEIQNKVYTWMSSSSLNSSVTLCEILNHYEYKNGTKSQVVMQCQDLDLNIFINTTVLTLSYSVIWLFISFMSSHVERQKIVAFIFLFCGFTCVFLSVSRNATIAMYFYVIMQVVNLNMTIVNSTTIDLFPTVIR
jgi:hypothetical protein